ncbi:MAG: NRDE family protein [Deltaproteobacteria bacterium]|nr:NRDE family protein [Deltaproteobacteria bacterium]
MCTLALYLQRFADYPLVVAANRDEFYERASAPPQLIAADPWVMAGQDLVAGGTWLGLNEAGLVVGLLNRRHPAGVDPSRRSRGLLALAMLECRSLEAALESLRGEHGDRYNGFNLLLATPAAAYVAHNAEAAIAITPLEPGVHLLTNLQLNDPTCPRIAKSARLFEAVTAGEGPQSLVHALQPILSDHSTPLDPRAELPPNNLCVHTPRYGTCSATVVLFARRDRRYHYFHAAGAPCRSRFEPVPLPN